MSETIEDRLTEAARDPASVAVDGQSVQARPIPDLIKLADRQAARDASRNAGHPLSFSQFEFGSNG